MKKNNYSLSSKFEDMLSFSMQDLDIIAYIKVDATERHRGFYGIFLIITRKPRSNHVLSVLFFCYNEFLFLYIDLCRCFVIYIALLCKQRKP